VGADLFAKHIASKADGSWSQLQLQQAHEEIVAKAAGDDSFRKEWNRPSRDFSWLDHWNKEIEPARLLGKHWQLPEDRRWSFPIGKPAIDANLSHPLKETLSFEFTIAFEDVTRGRRADLAGHQDALRSEKLFTVGHVSSFAELYRDPETKEIHEVVGTEMRLVEEGYGNWTRGIREALAGKSISNRSSNYGVGSILCVYAYGISGSPVFEAPAEDFNRIIEDVDAAGLQNAFDRTVVFGWHSGWMREVKFTSNGLRATEV
jgi:hypothetical protein